MYDFRFSRFIFGVTLAVFLVTLYHYLFHEGYAEIISNPNKLKDTVLALGIWGPISISGFMALAIIMSPIPSAPVALASGALFGHTWGTIYVLIGAEIGAMAAFVIARLVGYELLKKWFGEKLNSGIFKSQKNLTLIVLFSRMVPFISFDIISYLAGLSPISFWRFSMATLLGIIPISFLLAHFGSELGSADSSRVLATVLLLGLLTATPFFFTRWKRRNS